MVRALRRDGFGTWLVAVWVTVVACGGKDAAGGIGGTPCDYECTGPACNARCEGDIIYACAPSGVWGIERSCRLQGKVCEERLIGVGPEAEVVCVDAPVGSGGAGGSAGSALGGGSGTGASSGAPGQSPGTVQLSFSVEDVDAYCEQTDGCSPGPGISITDASGRALTLSAGYCPTLCSDCVAQPCPGLACIPMARQVNGATLPWDGSYWESGTCGQGVACVNRGYVPPGTYEATFCARRGTIAASSTTGETQCLQSGDPECTSVQFALPASGPVRAVLPGAGGSGAGGTGGTAGSGGGLTDPACTTADGDGFFSSCAACPTSNCDGIDTGGGTRSACGCSSSADCPCGLSCGSYEIAPGVSYGGICVR